MKPVYLEFCGVNSFSEKAQIDFGKLLEGGLFGIFGDTGSGKSTILDCIHFALYGKIERSSGSVTDSINEKCDRAYVVYDFEILHDGARHTYRVRRERRRKNNVAKAILYEADGEGKWQALAEGTNEVDRRVEEIIGLGFDDFKKCIALPQGEFAGLVRAKPSERLQLVSRLFDLEKYGEKLSAAVRGRCVAADNQLDVLRSRLQENAEGTEERVREEKEKLSAAVRERESVGRRFRPRRRSTIPSPASPRKSGSTTPFRCACGARRKSSPFTPTASGSWRFCPALRGYRSASGKRRKTSGSAQRRKKRRRARSCPFPCSGNRSI